MAGVIAEKMLRVADVAPDVPAQVIEPTYTYQVPDGMEVKPGDGVLISLGPRTVVGYVVSVRDTSPESLGFDPKKLRMVKSVLAGVSLPDNLMKTLGYLSGEYLAPLGASVSAAMPPGVRSRLATAYLIVEDVGGETPAQQKALDAIRSSGGQAAESTLLAKKTARSALRALVKRSILQRIDYLPPERGVRPKFLRLASVEEVDRFMNEEGRRRPTQAACLMALREAPAAALTAGEIKAVSGASDAVVAELLRAGLLEAVPEAPPDPYPAPDRLTSEQFDAVEAITASIRRTDGERFLLHGVTGSGKTEVYLRAIEEALQVGRQALYLVPEITLTAQVITQLRGRFGADIAIMHSGLPERERLRHWRMAREGRARVVLGARSAIFAPLDNIGVIIVDEEHESSYKQDSAPRYHMRALAEHRAKLDGATLILGSATPSVETYYRAKTGDLTLLNLPTRATAERMPEVSIVDLTELFRAGQPSILSPELRTRMTETLERGEQILLMINRRAYANSLLCRECGFRPKCENCSVTLVYHKRINRLQCHHCGFQQPGLDTCPACESHKIRPLGIGTEKVEEFVRLEFFGARVARLDRDVTRRRGAMEEVFQKLREGELDILVGTQMIAKGLDFPKVSLVGVITADSGVMVPDFRATERTFQLLTQVAGRAGRHLPGRVVIQTFQPDHPAVRFAAVQDYADFFEAEITEREDAMYPPFSRLVNIICSSKDPEAAEHNIRRIAKHLLNAGERAGSSEVSDAFGPAEAQERVPSDLVVTGPADCPIQKLHGRHRRHLLVKLTPGTEPAVIRIPQDVFEDRRVQVTVDVDPVSLL